VAQAAPESRNGQYAVRKRWRWKNQQKSSAALSVFYRSWQPARQSLQSNKLKFQQDKSVFIAYL
jgi:hypothetical protein